MNPTNSRDEVLVAWPDLFAHGRDMVVGTDLDALLSAAFLHEHYGWNVIGFYNLETIYLADGVSWDRARAAYWVDLDIARADITSIGHHILTWGGPHEPRLRAAHERSLNPNVLRGFDRNVYERKYPMSTIFLLHWFANAPITRNVTSLCLLWAADSSDKNMCNPDPAKRSYDWNVREWIEDWMPHPFLMETKEGWLTENYQRHMVRFAETFDRRSTIPLARLIGSKGITNPVVRPAGIADTHIQLILNHVCELLDWDRITVPSTFRAIRGSRINTELLKFVPPDDLFSYVLPYKSMVNYTTFAASDLV